METYPGFDRMTLKEYCGQIGLDVDTAVQKLQNAGFKAGSDMTIRIIADTASVPPSQIRILLEPSTLQAVRAMKEINPVYIEIDVFKVKQNVFS